MRQGCAFLKAIIFRAKASTESGSASAWATLTAPWLGFTAIQGAPAENPAFRLASHCIGVRALSRLMEWMERMTARGSSPAAMASRWS